MKMKNMITLALFGLAISATALASPAILKGKFSKAQGPVVNTLIITTPNDQDVKVKFWGQIGFSKSSPCSDLITLPVYNSANFPPQTVQYTDQSYKEISSSVGKPVTCIKFNVIYNNKKISTPAVKLTLDKNGNYINSMPKTENLDIK